MKKRLLSILLCLTLVCSFAVGCGKKDSSKDADSNNTKTETTSTPAPVKDEDVVAEKLKTIIKAFDESALEAESATNLLESGIGADATLKVTIGKDIASMYGLAGMEDITLDFSFDMKDAFAFTGNLLLNGNDILSLTGIADKENVYANLPKYSEQYMSVSIEEMLGMSLDELMGEYNEALASAPDAYEFLDSYVEFFDTFSNSLKFQNAEENVKVGTGDYTFTGKKYVTKASLDDVKEAFNNFAEKINTMTGEEIADISFDDTDAENLFVNYYEGSNGNYAWEFNSDSKAEEPVYFVATNKGFCLYQVTSEGDEVLAYSVKETENSGKIYIDETEIIYSNLTKNSIDVEFTDEATVKLSFNKAGDNATIKFTISEDNIASIDAVLEIGKDTFKAEASMTMQGIYFGSISLETKNREYSEIVIPSSALDIYSWTNTLDMEALQNDLMQLMEEYPELFESLMGLSGEGIGISDEVYATPTPYEQYTGNSDFVSGFENMTGYEIDSEGRVDFTPLEEEVMAANLPSTAFDTIPVSNEQFDKIKEYASNLYPSLYEYRYYNISGNVQYGYVDSYYVLNLEWYDPENSNADIELDLDAVSGELKQMEVAAASKEEAVSQMNDLLGILGLDIKADESVFDMYIEEDIYELYGYESYSGDSYVIYLDIYK